MSTTFRFGHERLDVYRVAVEFVAWSEKIDGRWFRGKQTRREQLQRAADSIVLNIAEGAAQKSRAARANHYRIAIGSAGECRAILELLGLRKCPVNEGAALLARIGAMLSKM